MLSTSIYVAQFHQQVNSNKNIGYPNKIKYTSNMSNKFRIIILLFKCHEQLEFIYVHTPFKHTKPFSETRFNEYFLFNFFIDNWKIRDFKTTSLSIQQLD